MYVAAIYTSIYFTWGLILSRVSPRPQVDLILRTQDLAARYGQILVWNLICHS